MWVGQLCNCHRFQNFLLKEWNNFFTTTLTPEAITPRSSILPHVSAMGHPRVQKTELHSYFIWCGITVMLSSWEIYCNKAVSSIFKPYVVKEILSSSCCSTHSKCNYQTISFPPDKLRFTLPFLVREKNLLLIGFPSCKTMYFLP